MSAARLLRDRFAGDDDRAPYHPRRPPAGPSGRPEPPGEAEDGPNPGHPTNSNLPRRRWLRNFQRFSDDAGEFATFSTERRIDLTGPFFQQFGTNGRACSTCHDPADGWTITPKTVRARFEATRGTDPIFRTVDGANSPNADVSTVEARRQSYSMLLEKGLIRVGLPIPANAEFKLTSIEDPHGFASERELSLFRRPLPTTNLKFLSAVMWDGRETLQDPDSTRCIKGTRTCFRSVSDDLSSQANDATLGHAEATRPLTASERAEIVRFQMTLFTAQVEDREARSLTAHGGRGGPLAAFITPFYFGINDVVAGDYRTGEAFDPVVFTLYDAWNRSRGRRASSARRAIARGESLFNERQFTISGVKGLNDELGAPALTGTCTTCHDTPNAGNHSIPAPLDIGIADASRRTPGMPLYTLENLTTGEVIQTTDPGRALITGKWKDVGRFKGPILRALASRAPYFHNGFAEDLEQVVEFYDGRFTIGLDRQERADLIAFLRSL